MKNKLFTMVILISSLLGLHTNADAQADSGVVANKSKGGAEKLLLAGEVSTLWQSNKVVGQPTTNSFGADPLGLMLMPLVKLTDRLFLDVQVGITANPAPGGGAGVSLNEAIIYYRLCNGVNIFAGNFQPRSGLYEGILDDFTNRYCSAPIGMGIGAQTQSGIGIQGGIQTGYSKMLYQLYMTNGPQLVLDSTGASNGQMNYGNYTAINPTKAFGGEIGWLPLSNSSLEIGASGQYAPKTGAAGSPYENISNSALAAYLNYFQTFGLLMLRAQGQYEMSETQHYLWHRARASDTALPGFGFTNSISGWYGGVTFRLAGSLNKFLSSIELGGRIGNLTPPKDAMWGGNPMNQYTVCLTYWFTWKTPINIAYDVYTQTGTPNVSTLTVRGMWFF